MVCYNGCDCASQKYIILRRSKRLKCKKIHVHVNENQQLKTAKKNMRLVSVLHWHTKYLDQACKKLAQGGVKAFGDYMWIPEW